MSGKGTAKPLKAKKKVAKEVDSDDDDFRAKKKADAVSLKAAQLLAAKAGPLKVGTTGIKKSGKK